MDTRVERTIDRMREQLHTQLSIKELAACAGLSVAQLTRLFRQDTGRTPAAFLQELRMARARILLECSTLRVSQVMTQVGIADPSQFSRGFRRIYGISPRALRTHLRRCERG